MNQPKTILLCHHGEFFRTLLGGVLEKSGYQVVGTGSVQETYEAFDRLPQVHLLILQLELPDMPGDEACLAIRGDPKLANVPILMVSDGEEEALRAAAERAGANGHLRIPFRPARVLEWIEHRHEHFASMGMAVDRSRHPLEPITAPPTQESRARVLLVDDEELPVEILSDLLRPQGYSIYSAHDWVSFRDAVMTEEFAVLLLDIRMPGVPGDKLAEFVRDLLPPPKPGVILHSGLPEAELRRIAHRVGAKNYLCKGCNPDYILRVVDAAVKAYQLDAEFAA